MKPIKCNTLKSRTDRPILHLVIATGIASVVTQLFFVREYLSQFQGNEIVIALVLFNWLILGGVGTRLAHRSKHPSADVLAYLSLVLAGLAVVQTIMVRMLRFELFTAGASVGFYPILIFCALTMAPYALLVGFVLPYSLYVIRRRHTHYPGARIYMADNVGDVCGGALFAFVLIHWASPMQSLLAANLPLLATALRISPWRWFKTAAALVVTAILVMGVMGEHRLLAPQVGRLLHYQESRFARLAVYRDQEQTTVFADGRPTWSTQNIALAEETVHYPLSQLTHAKRILLISAVGGMTSELEKYRPEAVDYIELDPLVTRLLFQYGLLAPVQGLNVIHEDARAWLRQSRQYYDAILISLPEPDTYQLNRFYTDAFFKMVKQHLASGGIFSFAVQGYANYMTTAEKEKIACLRKTAGRHFTHVTMLPAQRVFFLCRQQPIDPDIPARLAALGIATQYAGPYFYGNITAQRIQTLRRSVDPEVLINTDARPYLMQVMFTQWFVKHGTSPQLFMVVLAVVIGLYLLRLRREAFVLFTTGFMTMGSEVLVIFAFQIFLGYIYMKIGIIVTVFLAGLMPGAWLGLRLARRSLPLLFLSDLVLVMLILLMVLCLQLIGQGLPQLFYYGIGFFISLVCGFQFPLALAQSGDSNLGAARIFAVDLVGAACGALVISTVFIPYLGLGGTACALMGLKILSMFIIGERYAFLRSTRFSNG